MNKLEAFVEKKKKKGLSALAIVAICVGGVLVVAAIAAAVYHLLSPNYLEEFDDNFDEEFDDFFVDPDDEDDSEQE